jgi:hypothetical protein
MHYRSCNRLLFATLMLLILRIYLFRGTAESSTVQGVRSRRNKSFRVGNLQERANACQRVPRLESVGDNPTLSAFGKRVRTAEFTGVVCAYPKAVLFSICAASRKSVVSSPNRAENITPTGESSGVQ